MYAIGIILLFFVGYLTVFNISTLTTRLERIGLAFPVGVPNSVFYTSLQFVSGVCAFFHVQYHEKHHIHRNIDEHYGSERHAALI